ncbi:MAG TPA: ATPase, T2SS/T4P/T4SS family [Candidatus Hydrogenedentes bacterium]|nr:ATPase, T2SS/T4P/T4SS family [Candidatus Hydrogenedentota bacterium]
MLARKALEKQFITDGILDDEKLERARAEALRTGTSLLEVVPMLGYATPEAVYRSLANYCKLPFVQPSKMDIPETVIKNVPARFATHYGFVPIQEKNGGYVVAVSDPLNAQLLDDISLVLKKRIEPVVTTPEEIERATKTLYGLGADTVERILSEQDSVASLLSLDTQQIGSDLGDENIDASIIKFVNEVLMEAIQSAATDIHIEPFEDQLRVRYRIDGILHQVPTPATIRGFQSAIVSRIKIMANMNIAEKRLPQDGKIPVSLGDGQYDLRVSVLPTAYGETVNIRILSRTSMFLTLDQLGFLPDDLRQFNAFLEKPHGIILVTGPTGSGKTTTLYASLSKLNKVDRKVITIEDPIEYQLKGITQMQVQPRIGFDFSMGLRSMLRHDPDIMMVGEIRDFETAEMAIRSSLTGHLVFSTLHTNDAAGAVTRLVDMGVEPFLIASTMIASIAQRLVRCVCTQCAEPYTPDPAALREFGVSPKGIETATFRRGRGCDACRHTGYRGRIAIYEILTFTPTIKEMTYHRSPSTEIKRKGREQGMRTLRESGWQQVCLGRTTLEEVMRVTSDADVLDAIETGDASVQV